MTTTEIRAEIRQRNALRKAALLPLLDEQREFDHACAVIREQRYRAFRDTKQADYERIRQEVFSEWGRPRGFIASWGWSMEIDRRVDAASQLRGRDRDTDADRPRLSGYHTSGSRGR